jgi:hypothetical protein
MIDIEKNSISTHDSRFSLSFTWDEYEFFSIKERQTYQGRAKIKRF